MAGCPDLRDFWRSPIRFAVSAIVLLAVGVAFFQLQRFFEPASIGRQERTAGQESALSVDAISARHRAMVEEQLRGRDITDERVLAAMLRVPRHEFVPAQEQNGDGATLAYVQMTLSCVKCHKYLRKSEQ